MPVLKLLDLAEIQTLAANDGVSKLVELSPETRNICLALLEGASKSYAWIGDFTIAEDLTHEAIKEIIGPQVAEGPPVAAGLVAWFDGQDPNTMFTDIAKSTLVTNTGDPVAVWADKSGQFNDAVQTITSKRPSYNTGGWLDFDGVDDFLASDAIGVAIGASGQFTIVGVIQSQDTSNNARQTNIYCSFNADGSDSVRMGVAPQNTSSRPNRFIITKTNWSDDAFSPSGWTNVIKLVSVVHQSGQPPNAYDNGSTITLDPAAPSLTFTDATQFSLGHEWDNANPSDFFTGEIRELLIYDAALNATDRSAVEVWLAARWGL